MTPWFDQDRLAFAVGIEDTFVPQESVGRRGLDEYELTQHYRFWERDLELASAAGATMIRYGFPWYKLNPARDRFEWEWADRVVDKLDELGLRAIVDLMHYGTPLWLHNQFLNHSYPEIVAEYAARMAERYRGRLDIYTPLNEPTINSIFCGEDGTWPPYLTGHDGFVKMARSLVKGMVLTQRAIAEATGGEASFVHVEAAFRYAGSEPPPAPIELALERRYLVTDLLLGKVDGGHPLVDYLARHGFDDNDLAWCKDNSMRPDVMGVNYYPHLSNHVYDSRGVVERTEAWTDGLEDVVRTFLKRYDLPIFVTETSMTGSIERRIEWLDDSIACLHDLRSQGLPVVGYTWWPLFDLVDWDYRGAITPISDFLVPMGMYDLEADSIGTLHRCHTPIVDRFAHHAASTR